MYSVPVERRVSPKRNTSARIAHAGGVDTVLEDLNCLWRAGIRAFTFRYAGEYVSIFCMASRSKTFSPHVGHS